MDNSLETLITRICENVKASNEHIDMLLAISDKVVDCLHRQEKRISDLEDKLK